jgi:hypothetical protein
MSTPNDTQHHPQQHPFGLPVVVNNVTLQDIPDDTRPLLSDGGDPAPSQLSVSAPAWTPDPSASAWEPDMAVWAPGGPQSSAKPPDAGPPVPEPVTVEHKVDPPAVEHKVDPPAVEHNADPPAVEHKVDPRPSALTEDNLPSSLVESLGFRSLSRRLRKFSQVALLEVIKASTKQVFPDMTKKFCYRMDYRTLDFTALNAADNFTDGIIPGLEADYLTQHSHSISGEQKDMCYYTYPPEVLARFLRDNNRAHYTFLPLTTHAPESANGIRHDMLLIFDNREMKFYWFDCQNRTDYLPISPIRPKDTIDTFFTQFGFHGKLGYEYVPSPSWVIRGTLHTYGSIGEFDGPMSTAWCLIMIEALPSYDNPTGFQAVMDLLSEADRFNLMYLGMQRLLLTSYSRYLPKTSRVNLARQSTVNTMPLVRPLITPREPEADRKEELAPATGMMRLRTRPTQAQEDARPDFMEMPGLTKPRRVPGPAQPTARGQSTPAPDSTAPNSKPGECLVM